MSDVKKYKYSLKQCPGYEGHVPKNLSHEVKHCGNHHYYH